MLEDLGHSVMEAASGQDALAMLRNGERPDLIITDQVMPGLSGSGLAEQVKIHCPEIPVILASGYAELPSIPNTDLLKVSKPYSQDMIGWAIAEAMRTGQAPGTHGALFAANG